MSRCWKKGSAPQYLTVAFSFQLDDSEEAKKGDDHDYDAHSGYGTNDSSLLLVN